jgi:hypothetical protein
VSSLSRLLRACETTLEAMPGSGEGVDRTLIRDLLRLTPAERMATAAARRAAAADGGPLRALVEHGVRFVLIGDRAAHLYGSPAACDDVDVCHDTAADNLDRLGTALAALHARRRPDGRAVGARTLRSGDPLLLRTDAGPLDLHATPCGTTGYADLAAAAEQREFGAVEVPVAGLTDLIRMKRALGRPKDLIEVEVLLALRDGTMVA